MENENALENTLGRFHFTPAQTFFAPTEIFYVEYKAFSPHYFRKLFGKRKLVSTKFAKIAKYSQDTALRNIQDLLKKGILFKLSEGGRSTAYDVVRTQKM